MIPCKKCSFEHINESNIHLHHIVPKCIGGTDKDGRRYLCGENKGNDCHREWDKFLMEQQDVKDLLKKKFEEWINQ